MPLPAKMILDSDEALLDEVRLLQLRSDYEDLKKHPAWVHHTGLLLSMKEKFEKGILIGERDRFGVDVTDKLRASYGTVMQILAIPAQIEDIQRQSEITTMGLHID